MRPSQLVSSVQSSRKLAYTVKGSEDDKVLLELPSADNGSIYPEEVAAAILRHLIDAAEAQAGAQFDRAVISVPAYFNQEQCEATMAAGAPPSCNHILASRWLVFLVGV